jgi:hypothetical protein
MAEDIVGSHELPFTGGSKTGRGQNGDSSPSSVYKAPDPIGKVSPPSVTVPTANSQTRDVGKSDTPIHDGMRDRNHEGGTVPAAPSRSVPRGLARRF